MANELRGKVAIVTGGASGIGRATVELFVRENARVVVADINEEDGENLAADLGESACFLKTDVSDERSVQALVDHAIERFGGLDIMFNNAGMPSGLFADFLDDDLNDFHRVVNVNLLGVMLGTQHAARHMAKNGGGSIINTGSLGGSVAGFGVMSYRAAKAGVIHFSKCAAIDLARHSVRVNVINPGHIRTRMSSWEQTGMSASGFQKLQRELDEINLFDQPIKRHGTPEDVAQAALYLAGDRSVQVTGIVMPVDGGTNAGDTVNHVQQILEAQARAFSPETEHRE